MVRLSMTQVVVVAAAFALTGCTTTSSQVDVKWTEHPQLGPILTDGDGNTLYIFTNDENGTSSCYDQCAASWPPLGTDGGPTGADDIGDELGTTQRDDGTIQVTYGGDPLYYFANDDEPGDANGEGVGGVWFVVNGPA